MCGFDPLFTVVAATGDDEFAEFVVFCFLVGLPVVAFPVAPFAEELVSDFFVIARALRSTTVICYPSSTASTRLCALLSR